jgi:hypothetical protein
VIDRDYQISSARSCTITSQTPPHDLTMEFGPFYDTEAFGIELYCWTRVKRFPVAFSEDLPSRIF